MALLDDIAAKIAQYTKNPYTTSGASSAVNSINNQYTGSALDQLNALRNKYNTMLTGYKNQLGQLDSTYQPIFDTLNQNATKAKTENQDVLNQNAVDENTLLRRITEQMANYGSLGSGQYPVLQTQANAARQNNDTKIYNQRASDVANYLTQLSQQQAKKAAAQNEIKNNINSASSQGESDLASLLASINSQRLAAVQNQQAAETAAAEAMAEKQYEAKLAAQAAAAKQQAAAKSAAASSSAKSSSSSSSSSDVRNAQMLLNEIGYNLSVDGYMGPNTRAALIDFQRKHGLSTTGSIDSSTRSYLSSLAAGSVNAQNSPMDGRRTSGGTSHYVTPY